MQVTVRVLGALIAFTLVAGSAAAASSVSILDLAAEAEPLETGGTASLPFTVNFQADGFGCPQGGSVTLALEARGTPPAGIIFAVEPAEVTISIPAGLYMTLVDGAPVGSFNGSAPATLAVTADNVTQNETVPVTVVATYAGGAPTDCQGDVAAAEGDSSVMTSFIAPPPPAPEPVEVQEGGKFLPAPGALAVIGAAAAGIAFSRRKA